MSAAVGRDRKQRGTGVIAGLRKAASLMRDL